MLNMSITDCSVRKPQPIPMCRSKKQRIRRKWFKRYFKGTAVVPALRGTAMAPLFIETEGQFIEAFGVPKDHNLSIGQPLYLSRVHPGMLTTEEP